MHARWFSFLQCFDFTTRNIPEQHNKVADALSRRTSLLTIIRTTVTAFDTMKDSYEGDGDFSELWKQCKLGEQVPGFKQEKGILFKENRLCIPKTSLNYSYQEAHLGGLAGHFGRDIVISQLKSWFFWPNLKKKETSSSKDAQHVKKPKE